MSMNTKRQKFGASQTYVYHEFWMWPHQKLCQQSQTVFYVGLWRFSGVTHWMFMCVFPCISLHLSKAFCIVLCHNLFLCWCCSFLTCHNSLLFYFIRYIIGNFFVVVLYVYVCFLAFLCNFCEAFCIVSCRNFFLCWCCWFLTHDNSLCFISLGTLLEASDYSLWLYWVFMCVFTCIILLCLCEAFCVMWHHHLFLCCCCCCCCSFSLMVLIKPVACHLTQVKGADRYTVTSVFNWLN